MLTNEERNKGRVRYEPETKMWIGVKTDGTLVEDKNRRVVEQLLYVDSVETLEEGMLPAPIEDTKISPVLGAYPTYVLLIIFSVSVVVAFVLGLLLGFYLK